MSLFRRLRAAAEKCRIAVRYPTDLHGLMVPLGTLVPLVICLNEIKRFGIGQRNSNGLAYKPTGEPMCMRGVFLTGSICPVSAALQRMT